MDSSSKLKLIETWRGKGKKEKHMVVLGLCFFFLFSRSVCVRVCDLNAGAKGETDDL